VCLSACLAGEVATQLSHGQYERARDAAGEFRDVFGPDRFWLEMQDHGLEEQRRVNEAVPRLARELGLGTVATNDCHYLLRDDHAAHVAGTIGASGANVVNAEGMAPNVTIASWDARNDATEMINAVTSPGGPGHPTPIQISSHSYGKQM